MCVWSSQIRFAQLIWLICGYVHVDTGINQKTFKRRCCSRVEGRWTRCSTRRVKMLWQSFCLDSKTVRSADRNLAWVYGVTGVQSQKSFWVASINHPSWLFCFEDVSGFTSPWGGLFFIVTALQISGDKVYDQDSWNTILGLG